MTTETESSSLNIESSLSVKEPELEVKNQTPTKSFQDFSILMPKKICTETESSSLNIESSLSVKEPELEVKNQTPTKSFQDFSILMPKKICTETESSSLNIESSLSVKEPELEVKNQTPTKSFQDFSILMPKKICTETESSSLNIESSLSVKEPELEVKNQTPTNSFQDFSILMPKKICTETESSVSDTTTVILDNDPGKWPKLIPSGLKGYFLNLSVCQPSPMELSNWQFPKTTDSHGSVKIIKTRLRSTIGQDRLESLMILSCERDISINYEEAIIVYAMSSDLLKG
ncbi:uncharacterized protein LOC107885000 [Acyrthosiphon pisum]|uniref:Uncharacterized protein n=1 Tax=Acyrthosiphon pisum TaxID=7029 RepID=A0A8R2H8H2_ACYPI|nr:uncharacterized protein LOC107885000 [Acyrthosiphon pisum]|eukprot:XP_016663756.1 PREDICTED: uncharacterized protein LOC107885000 [Acyrthosiphon pisum]